MSLLKVIIPGEPVAKGRPRVVSAGGFARAYTPQKTINWEGLAGWYFQAQWKGAAPYTEPVVLHVSAVKSRPKRLLRKKDPDGLILRPAKPDLDNVIKIVGDALERAAVLKNDIQIVEIHAYSYYAERDLHPWGPEHLRLRALGHAAVAVRQPRRRVLLRPRRRLRRGKPQVRLVARARRTVERCPVVVLVDAAHAGY